MKKCPNCQQLFNSDEIFCVADGAPLAFVQQSEPSRFYVSLEEPPPIAQPPLFKPPLPAAATVAADSSKPVYYLAVGGMLAIIMAMTAGFFALRRTGEKETAQFLNQTGNTAIASPTAATNQTADTPSNLSLKTAKREPKANTGAGNYPAGNSYTASNSYPAGNSYSSVNSASGGFRLTRNFVRTFSGAADNDSVSMRLERSGTSLTGRVFSRRSATEITVSGSIDSSGYFQMSEYSDVGVMTGSYGGRINPDGTMTGTWTKPDGTKPRSFFMRAN